MTETNHYETLEVRDFASSEVVKGAYKHLSQRWHPDKNPEDSARASAMATAINAAYSVLSDPVRRASFDRELRARQERKPSSTPPPAPDSRRSSAGKGPAAPPQHHRPYAEHVRAAERPPGRARFYLCLYALGFAAYGMFHFDLAGAGWGSALIVVTIIGMLIATYRPTNEGGFRVLIATGVICVLVAFYGRTHPVEAVAEPDVGNSGAPIAPSDAPPLAALPSSSESAAGVTTVSDDEPSVPIEEVAARPLDAQPPTEATAPSLEGESGVADPPDTSTRPAQETVTRPAQVTLAPLRYPPQAVRLRHEGTVTLEVSVDASGSIASIKVAQSSGWPELDREAERSRTAVVVSAYRDGYPVDSVVRIPVTFSLKN